ncbi:MAG: ABC-2 family transporter protein [bacterium]|nr:ABC-2 family transporter protein [bacterium]
MSRISLLFKFLTKNTKEFMVDKENFFIYFFTILLQQGTGLIFIWVIFDKIPFIVGWSLYEVVFIYGFFQVITGIFYFLFAWTLWFPDAYLINRKMDIILSCPLPAYYHVFLQEIGKSAMEIISPILGFVILGIAISHLSLDITVLFIVKIIIGIISGTLLLAGIFTIFTSISFWVKSRISFTSVLMSFMDFGQYPITIYSNILRLILTWVVPFGFIAFYPSASILKPLKFGNYIWVGFPVAVVFFLFGLLLWNAGLKRYESAGT